MVLLRLRPETLRATSLLGHHREDRRATYQEGTAESHEMRNRRIQREVLCEMGGHLWVRVQSVGFLPRSFKRSMSGAGSAPTRETKRTQTRPFISVSAVADDRGSASAARRVFAARWCGPPCGLCPSPVPGTAWVPTAEGRHCTPTSRRRDPLVSRHDGPREMGQRPPRPLCRVAFILEGDY